MFGTNGADLQQEELLNWNVPILLTVLNTSTNNWDIGTHIEVASVFFFLTFLPLNY